MVSPISAVQFINVLGIKKNPRYSSQDISDSISFGHYEFYTRDAFFMLGKNKVQSFEDFTQSQCQVINPLELLSNT